MQDKQCVATCFLDELEWQINRASKWADPFIWLQCSLPDFCIQVKIHSHGQFSHLDDCRINAKALRLYLAATTLSTLLSSFSLFCLFCLLSSAYSAILPSVYSSFLHYYIYSVFILFCIILSILSSVYYVFCLLSSVFTTLIPYSYRLASDTKSYALSDHP